MNYYYPSNAYNNITNNTSNIDCISLMQTQIPVNKLYTEFLKTFHEVEVRRKRNEREEQNKPKKEELTSWISTK